MIRIRFFLLFLFFPFCLNAQELGADLRLQLDEKSALTEFRTKPDGLVLIPQYSGSERFIIRHRELKAQAVQEALFLFPASRRQPDSRLAYSILLETPSLSGLRFHLSRTRSYKLFDTVSFIEYPSLEDPRCVIQIEDNDFGTVRFLAETENYWNRIELRMLNLDPLKYLFFSAVPSGNILIDLVYFPAEEQSLVYTAWSVRPSLFIPRMAVVEQLLYRRAMAVNRWFMQTLERIEP